MYRRRLSFSSFFQGYSRSNTMESADSTTVPLPNRRTSLDANGVGDDRPDTDVDRRNGETISEEGASVAENYPVWCVALYDYQVKDEGQSLLFVCDENPRCTDVVVVCFLRFSANYTVVPRCCSEISCL
jgi:hypothetical protein